MLALFTASIPEFMYPCLTSYLGSEQFNPLVPIHSAWGQVPTFQPASILDQITMGWWKILHVMSYPKIPVGLVQILSFLTDTLLLATFLLILPCGVVVLPVASLPWSIRRCGPTVPDLLHARSTRICPAHWSEEGYSPPIPSLQSVTMKLWFIDGNTKGKPWKNIRKWKS